MEIKKYCEYSTLGKIRHWVPLQIVVSQMETRCLAASHHTVESLFYFTLIKLYGVMDIGKKFALDGVREQDFTQN